MPVSAHQRRGYIVVDHRESPGVPVEVTRALGLPDMPEGSVVEMDFYTCGHCQGTVIKNPDRTRERAYCRGCDRIICDLCEAARVARGFECEPIAKKIDSVLEAASRGLPVPLLAARG